MVITDPKKILILGGGFGGLAAATELRQNLPKEVKITILDKKDYFMMGLVKLWILNGTRELEPSKKPLDSLTQKGIDFVQAEIIKIDPKNKLVATKSNEFSYDFLIISLGVDYDPGKIKGLLENGLILYEINNLEKIREQVRKIKTGKIAVVITSMPYKCPPAPFEASTLIHTMLTELGTRNSVQIDFYSPAPITLPAAGPQVSEEILQLLKSKNINFHGLHKIVSVEKNTLNFENSKTNFDLLIAVPPHKVPSVVTDSGISQPGKFISVDRTCKTNFEGVYAIGDVNEIMVTEKIPVPKAGIFAEGEGVTVAKNIISQIRNEKEHATFDGKGGCYMEMGKGIAGYLEVDLFSSSTPQASLKQPNETNFKEKERFEKERLAKWL